MSTLKVKDAIYRAEPFYVHGFRSLRSDPKSSWVVVVARKGKTFRSTQWLKNESFSEREKAEAFFNEMRGYVDQLASELVSAKANKKANRANALALYKAGTPHPWKVGDLCHTSWGYDQTNVEAYQVVRILSRTSMVVRAIGGDYEATGWASGRFSPKRDQFIGEEQVVHAGFSVYRDGSVSESWRDPKYKHGLYPTLEGQSHYTSSYA